MKRTKIIALIIMLLAILGAAAFYSKHNTGGSVKSSNSGSGEEIVTTADAHKVLIDRPKGYMLSFPDNMNIDTSVSPEQIKAYNDTMTVIVTREWAPYEDPWYLIDNYLNDYYLNDYYIKSNDITIHNDDVYEHNGAKAQFIALTRSPKEQHVERQNSYAYFFVRSKTAKQAFFRVMFKTSDYQNDKAVIDEIKNSFEEINVEGQNQFKCDYAPVPSETWNSETKKLYNKIKNSKSIEWGLFVDGAYTIDRNYQWFKELEQKVDYDFDFALHYVNLDWEFPVKELTRFYNDGKITELTLQTSNFNNDDLYGDNINFDIYDGLLDDQIREFARGAKEFGHPFLFRLNNEVNSDWVNYSGVATLSDPEVCIYNWSSM